jgi:3-oxoacyl-[acyl-carrier protein] reductase
VAAADLEPAGATAAAVQALGRRGLALRVDVARRASVGRAVAAVETRLGRLDILVNNAGITHRDRLENTSERTWDRVVAVILKGAFLCCQAALPGMRARGYGKIVNVASISGIIGGAVSRRSDRPRATRGRTGPAYAAAKGGVIALTRWVAKDAGADGVYVNAVAPGPVETAMTRGFAYPVDRLPIARLGTPEDVAEAVVFLASPASNYVTGQVLCVDGGWVMT